MTAPADFFRRFADSRSGGLILAPTRETLVCVLIDKIPFIPRIRNGNSNVTSHPGGGPSAPTAASRAAGGPLRLTRSVKFAQINGIMSISRPAAQPLAVSESKRYDRKSRGCAIFGMGRCVVILCYRGVLLRNYNLRTGTNTPGTPLRYETRIRWRAHYRMAVIASGRGRPFIDMKGIGV
jgi:hypothetical protein